jgi:hypothetical protein
LIFQIRIIGKLKNVDESIEQKIKCLSKIKNEIIEKKETYNIINDFNFDENENELLKLKLRLRHSKTLGSKFTKKSTKIVLTLAEFGAKYFSDTTGVDALYKIIDQKRKTTTKSPFSNVLSNTLGIENSDGYARATKERAYLDTIYRSKKYYIE